MTEDTAAKRSTLGTDLLLYTVARVLAVAVPATILVLVNTPVLVALAVGLVLGLGLSLVLLRPLRARISVALAERAERRGAARRQLEAQLRGEDEPAT
ncbi:hypothetical protein AHOG_02375 [Actinoalloteichus hoggarensis]|uniref:DUF4229 domain-containing protein n=2 Tax=Actinoalloteichus hoggarensis TaxID=1470176 RepID=A0A221VX57_9PSEU|nr:DUF4229 domain-containing protein [Actinoalloteichus hoggarensis]ASO18139.1 hypothetical protein AHOG_02375 [Actinoalloteichus hoggarensis]